MNANINAELATYSPAQWHEDGIVVQPPRHRAVNGGVRKAGWTVALIAAGVLRHPAGTSQDVHSSTRRSSVAAMHFAPLPPQAVLDEPASELACEAEPGVNEEYWRGVKAYVASVELPPEDRSGPDPELLY